MRVTSPSDVPELRGHCFTKSFLQEIVLAGHLFRDWVLGSVAEGDAQLHPVLRQWRNDLSVSGATSAID